MKLTKVVSSLLRTMANTCSFQSTVGGQCDHDRRERNRAKECIPLLSCHRDVTGHKAMFAFDGIGSEVKLILARESIFFSPQIIDQMTVLLKGFTYSLGRLNERYQDSVIFFLILFWRATTATLSASNNLCI